MFLRLLILFALLWLSHSSIAQGPPGNVQPPSGNLQAPPGPPANAGNGPGRFSGPGRNAMSAEDRKHLEVFFRAIQETRSHGAQEMAYLLFQKSVRKELGLTEENEKALRDNGNKLRQQIDQLRVALKANEIDEQQLVDKLKELVNKADDQFIQGLGTPDKLERLIGIFVQHRKASSALNSLVAERIGLSEQKRKEILIGKESLEKELMEKAFSQDADPDDRHRAWGKIQRKIDDYVAEKLDADQLEKLDSVKGEAFAFEPPFGPGRPSRDRGERSRDCCEIASKE